MTIGVGILIAAVGAILHFAVESSPDGLDLQTVGTILMIAGGAIAVIALIATMSRRSRAATAPAGYRTTVVEDPPDSSRI